MIFFPYRHIYYEAQAEACGYQACVFREQTQAKACGYRFYRYVSLSRFLRPESIRYAKKDPMNRTITVPVIFRILKT